MCQYCERRTDVKFGWDQPALPYEKDFFSNYRLNGNIGPDFKEFEGHIFDYQTSNPELVLSKKGFFDGEGVGCIYIPIKFCPECGRQLGSKEFQKSYELESKKET